MDQSPQSPTPASDSAQSPPPVAVDDDVALHHRSISDDMPSPSGLPPPGKTFSAKASASSFASKLAFGGRKLLSPLTSAASGVKEKEGAQSPPTQSAGEAPKSAVPTRTGSSRGSLAGVVNGADTAVASAASAVTSSISSLFQATSSTLTSAMAVASPAGTAVSTGNSLDAAELEAMEAEQIAAQQRMQTLEELVQHRRSDWSYLKAMHEGTNYWLNVTLLREQQVLAHLGERNSIRRSVQFFYLGLGLGRLMSEVRHAQFLAMEGCQLLEELEFYFSSGTVQSMKLMVATNSTLHPPLHKMEDEALYSVQEPFRPTIFKCNQRPVFRRLLTPSIPFPLDYREVMLSLCDILALVYSKFVEDNSCSENVYLFQAIVRFDEKIKL
ncbi:hypothetical protein P43SY_007718 [Pythium insidiosum]|uniref:Uncharacterized protein n=1 Tax=Pythium insidiosum TaxID=114742 RepID=A0AAD5M5W6_PYTIN|nr:hypothetical protein P43SY_007718 [Pythium insidiosum]